MTAGRELRWDGCLNVRDLGGLPTAGGGKTRFGAVVRADSLRRLSPAGWDAAVAYGIRTVIDLRFPEELEADPPHDLSVGVVSVPLFDRPPAHRVVLRGATPEEWVADAYLDAYERRRPEVARAVAAVADALPGGGVVVHCAAGKDRTGMVVALLLRLAGVPAEAIAADYALSAASLAEDIAAWVAGAEDGDEREFRRRLGAAPAGAMLRVLDGLGDVRAYLLQGGVKERQLDAVVARLRG